MKNIEIKITGKNENWINGSTKIILVWDLNPLKAQGVGYWKAERPADISLSAASEYSRWFWSLAAGDIKLKTGGFDGNPSFIDVMWITGFTDLKNGITGSGIFYAQSKPSSDPTVRSSRAITSDIRITWRLEKFS